MKLLALESSAKAASCAILEDGQVIGSAWQATGLTHSRTLLPMVEDMLKNSELTVQDMDAASVVAGQEKILPFYGEAGGWHRIYTGEIVEAYAI